MAWAVLSNIVSHTLLQLSMNRVLRNGLLLCSWLSLGLLLNCETPIKRNEVIVETMLYFKERIKAAKLRYNLFQSKL